MLLDDKEGRCLLTTMKMTANAMREIFRKAELAPGGALTFIFTGREKNRFVETRYVPQVACTVRYVFPVDDGDAPIFLCIDTFYKTYTFVFDTGAKRHTQKPPLFVSNDNLPPPTAA